MLTRDPHVIIVLGAFIYPKLNNTYAYLLGNLYIIIMVCFAQVTCEFDSVITRLLSNDAICDTTCTIYSKNHFPFELIIITVCRGYNFVSNFERHKKCEYRSRTFQRVNNSHSINTIL